MLIVKNDFVGKLAVEYPQMIDIFDYYGIEYYCFGEKTISEICKEDESKIEKLLSDLNIVSQGIQPQINPLLEWTLGRLLDYVDTIHVRIREELAQAKSYLHTLATDETHRVEVDKNLSILIHQLKKHHHIEEEFTIPYFRDIQQSIEQGDSLSKPFIGDLEQHLEIMRLEHEVIARRFKRVGNLTGYYKKEQSESENIFFAQLNKIDGLLKHYIHIENNIVFPKVISLKKEIDQYI